MQSSPWLCGLWLGAVLAIASLAAQVGARITPVDKPKENKLWPEDLTLDVKGLHSLAQSVCERSGSRAEEGTKTLEEEVRKQSEIKAVGFSEKPGIGGLLPYILSVRGEQLIPTELSSVVGSCDTAARSSAETGCSEAWDEYFLKMAMPFAIPLLLGGLSCITHSVCCFVACCRCCRRMVCCKERLSPRNASFSKKVATMLIWVPVGITIFLSGLSVHANSFDFHNVLNWHLCTVLQIADEAIGGSDDMLFLGTEHAHRNLLGIAKALDIDGTTMYTIRKVIDQTKDFATKQDQLQRRVAHFTSVLEMSGPTVRAFEHRCVFCSLAVGDKNHLFQGFPKEGLLPAILYEISESSSQAMDGIRQFTSTRLTGDNLTALASKVKRSIGAFEILDGALRAAFVDTWAQKVPSVDSAESVRLFIFIVIGMSAMSSVPFGWIGFFITRVRMKTRPDVVPSGKPHCCSWCCGFCYMTASLLVGGLLVMAALFGAEGCMLARLELLDHGGLEQHAAALGLVPKQSLMSSGFFDGATWQASSNVAVDLAQTCFTVNGTGDMLSQMELDDGFSFQPELSSAFWRLEERISEPPAGHKTSDYMYILQQSATNFGGMFVLDPLSRAAGGNKSLGILELNPNVKELLLGSSVVPEDTNTPDGRAKIRGLNTYSALIAGPGKYTFAHGTAGGGFVIRPDRPDSNELASLPTNVRNALLYARAKEQLLVSNDSLRCDELDEKTGVVSIRRCGVKTFHAFILAEVSRLSQAMQASSAAALLVQHLFLTELRQEVAPTLRLVRDLRMMTRCRFLWRRLESIDDSTCEKLTDTLARTGCMMLAMSFVGTLGTLVHYKVWRHLKDNKVVGLELLRFEKTYKEFQRRLKEVEDLAQNRENQKKRYAAEIEQMHANALQIQTDQQGVENAEDENNFDN